MRVRVLRVSGLACQGFRVFWVVVLIVFLGLGSLGFIFGQLFTVRVLRSYFFFFSG